MRRDPPDVSNFVMTIVVNTIKRVRVRRFVTQMMSKFFKILKTELNTPPTIASVVMNLWIVTPRVSTSICSPFRRPFRLMLQLIASIFCKCMFSAVTAARFCTTTRNAHSGLDRHNTAITSAFPITIATFIFAVKSQYGQFKKYFTSQVNKARVNWPRTLSNDSHRLHCILKAEGYVN